MTIHAIVPIEPANQQMIIELARSMAQFEEEIAKRWEELYTRQTGAAGGKVAAANSIKDYPGAVKLFLTSLSDGDFDKYYERIDRAGETLARTREQYEDLILSFHMYEESTFPYIQRHSGNNTSEVLLTLDHLYHNVVAILARAYFRELDKEREKFIGILAHDIRTPLNTISLSADLMLRMGTQQLSTERLSSMAQKIRFNVKRMAELIDALLSYGQLKSGRFTPVIAEIDLVKIARDVVLSQAPERTGDKLLISLNGRDIRIRHSDQWPVIHIRSDQQLVMRALDNYVSNAIKYASSKVEITLTEKTSEIVFCVRDDGPGIPADQLEHIFDDYYQIPGSKPGSGLGLSSVRMIASTLGGRVWVESQPGAGSRFCMGVPSRAA